MVLSLRRALNGGGGALKWEPKCVGKGLLESPYKIMSSDVPGARTGCSMEFDFLVAVFLSLDFTPLLGSSCLESKVISTFIGL